MKIIHLSAECYPVAKVGGLADVVGALPKYLVQQEVEASVAMPKYDNEWVSKHEFETVFEGRAPLGDWEFDFRIQREVDDTLGFPLFMVDIPGLFDRPGVYVEQESGAPYGDEFERFISFQIAVLDWINQMSRKPEVVHCHDHHTALVPFMMTQSYRYQALKHIPTALTVHNGEYQGVYDHGRQNMLPYFDPQTEGLLDWDGRLNSLAAGLKTCWKITTVSPSYMEELGYDSHGLEGLFQHEKQKSQGIINGIDTEVWDPATDPMIAHHYDRQKTADGKRKNKQALCEQFGLDPQYPTISFIGRLVHEKGADMLPDLFRTFLESPQSVNFIVLGTGDRNLHRQFEAMSSRFVGYFDAALDYNEPLAHQIYAGSDFMIMPSRVEPCGLNQMYSMRYGTVPIVRKTGGLKDTVVDLGDPDGYGITFYDFSLDAARHAVQRAIDLFRQGRKMAALRKKIMHLDFSWNASAKKYIALYKELSN
ncbi:glycogen synthase [Fodinibius sediminis]|uniref:Glycogen synthase n=1 Tax=Fodinibius sediminis TaxID=1214077 RepID=A0A521D0J8_9BACT|nr:glycogen synthase [Fodinibius sediminis]SMO65223.1 starch synthase [Fodinibius sediminis]